MTTLKTQRPDVLEYLHAVRATLADLPAEERDELMVDVETALFEAAEESDGPLTARLGPPERFAADLRAAAGLQEPPQPAAAPAARLLELLAKLRDDPRFADARRIATELAPIWWVARGFVAFQAVTMALGADTSVRHPWMPALDGGPLSRTTFTLIVLGLVIAASLWLGIRRRRHRRAALAVNVLCALAVLPLALTLGDRANWNPAAQVVSVDGIDGPAAQPGLHNGQRPIRNIYPYSRDGRLLRDVLLYDDVGAPVEVGSEQVPDPLRRVLTTRDGRKLFNSFPVFYFDPGTSRVANPSATSAPIAVAEIAGPRALRDSRAPE